MNRKRRDLVWIVAVVAALVFPACAGEKKPEIVLKGASIVLSPKTKGLASSFLYIINDGNRGDVLTGCSVKEYPSARGMLHDFEGGRMVMVPEIPIPAGETTALERGSLHLMFSGLPETLDGDVTLVLNFKNSGTLETRATRQ